MFNLLFSRIYLIIVFLLFYDHSFPTKIGLEGMPGGGKTESFTYILQYMDNKTVFLPEINLEENCTEQSSEDVWEKYHTLWKDRIQIIDSFQSCDLNFISDRTYFSNLAFTYAQGDMKNYEIQKKKIIQDFKDNTFDLIIILDVYPAIGLKRRLLNHDTPPFPWGNISFLTRLREFYKNELPKLYKGKIFYINTSNLTLCTTVQKVKEIIAHHISLKARDPYVINELDKDTLLKFAKKHKLGRPYTLPLNILSTPTIYFRQHGVQLDENNRATYLNNIRLKHALFKFCQNSSISMENKNDQ